MFCQILDFIQCTFNSRNLVIRATILYWVNVCLCFNKLKIADGFMRSTNNACIGDMVNNITDYLNFYEQVM